MSINQIILPKNTVNAFYKKNLVGSKETQKSVKPSTMKVFSTLGNNDKNILILVNENDSMYLADAEFQFLTGILTACKLTMNDVAILNIQKNNSVNYMNVRESLNPDFIIMFDVSPDNFSLPLNFPFYQIQQYNQQIYLTAPKLSFIAHDKSEKLKLWNALRQIFRIG